MSSEGDEVEFALPCPKCDQYYPGDCFRDGCKSDLCLCDGCQIHFGVEE